MSHRTVHFSRFATSLTAAALLCVSAATGRAEQQKPVAPRVPAAVTNGAAKMVAHAAADQQFDLAIALPVRNEAALDRKLADLQNRSSAGFHKYLTVEQFADQFAPSKAEYAEVVSYLKAQGFNVTVQHANRLVVSFTGNTQQVERAFHVTMNNYQHPTEARTFYAPDREPAFPGLKVPVLLIAGLDNYVLPVSRLKNRGQMAHATPRAPEVIANANPTVTCYGPPYTVNVGDGPCGTYTPNDMRIAYYGGTALTGAGQQIGILGFGGFYPADLAGFAAVENMSVPTVVYQLGSACAASCSDGEQMLDVLWAAGMAPGITQINFFTNNSNDLTMINAEASSTASSVYSCSWGWGSGNATAEDTDFKEMQAQGQTFLNATGDDGGYNSTTWAYPSGDPYITEVGGTQVVTNGKGGSWSSELGWPGSSGGVPPASGLRYAIPAWQSPAANSSNGISSTYRSDPDISGEADYEMLGCTGSKKKGNTCVDTYGGTSYATPSWAGFIALLNQASVAAGNGTLGFANEELYQAGLNSQFKSNFHDVTACGGIDGPGPGPACNSSDEGSPVTGFNPVAGFDDVTGWGSPNGLGLIDVLSIPTLAISGGTGGVYYYSSSIVFAASFPEFSGTVTFYDTPSGGSQATLGTCSLSSGTCSMTKAGSALGTGTFSIVAVYQETSTSTKKYSAAQNLTIVADTTSTSVVANPNAITAAGSTTVTATVTDAISNATSPAGSVKFTLGSTSGTLLGTCTLSNGSCSIMVSGSSLQVGSNTIFASYTGSTAFGSSSNSTTVTVSLGVVTFSSVSHNFGQVAVGTAATAYGITITNTSTSAAYPFSVVFTPARGFTSANNCGTSIAAGAKCQLNFYFTPAAPGAVSATWSLAPQTNFSYSPSNGGTLTGSGTSQGGVSITTAGHNFGTLAVGTLSATYGTVISNSTSSAVTLNRGTVSGPFTAITNCPAMLAAGSSCNLQFTFKPTAPGTVQQVYTLTSSPTALTVGGNPLPNGGVTLTGTGQ